MFAVALIALLSAGALWIVSRQARPQPVLAVVPMALLFLTIPTPVAVVQLVGGFRQAADQHLRGGTAIVSYCAALWNAALAGGLGYLMTIGLAAALQIRAAFRTDDEPTTEGPPPGRWQRWVLVSCSLLVVPVAFYIFRSQRIPMTVMRAAQGAEQGQVFSSAQLREFTATVARECVLAVVYGVALSAALFAAGVASLSASRRSIADGALTTYSWGVLMLSSLIVVWAMLQANADSRLFASLPR